MTQDTKAETVTPDKKSAQLPVNLPLEFIPLYDWWKTNGTQFMIKTGLAAVLIVSVFGGTYYYKSRISSANKELLKASTTEELETLVNNYGTWKIGNTARLRLAKSYYDAGRYEHALEMYDTCISKGAPAGFAEVALMGRAICFEALPGQLDKAAEAYEAFQKGNPSHFLATQAQLGQARVLALQGKKDEAKRMLETLKAAKNKEPMAEMAIAQLQGVIARYEPRKDVSLTDTALAPVAVPATAPVTPVTK
jgi:predicted negative regulator of RcsB-dependent stress response